MVTRMHSRFNGNTDKINSRSDKRDTSDDKNRTTPNTTNTTEQRTNQEETQLSKSFLYLQLLVRFIGVGADDILLMVLLSTTQKLCE